MWNIWNEHILSHIHSISFILWTHIPHPPLAKSLHDAARIWMHTASHLKQCLLHPSPIHWSFQLVLQNLGPSHPAPKKFSHPRNIPCQIVSSGQHGPTSRIKRTCYFSLSSLYLYPCDSFLSTVWHVLTALHGQSELDTNVAKGHN